MEVTYKEKLKAAGLADRDIDNLAILFDELVAKSEGIASSKVEEAKKAIDASIEALKTSDVKTEIETLKSELKNLSDKVEIKKSEETPVNLRELAKKAFTEKSETFVSGERKSMILVSKAATEMLDIASSLAKTSTYEGIQKAPMFDTPIFDLFSKGNEPASRIDWTDRSTTSGATAVVARGAVKPLLSTDYTDRTAKPVTLAGTSKISKQLRSDFPAIMTEVEEIINYDLSQKVEHEILFSADPAIPGITTKCAAYVATPLDLNVKLPNNADAIRAAILQISLLGYKPNVGVLNPGDAALLDLTKDANGNYIKFQIDGVLKQLRIVESKDMPAGHVLVADSTKWKVKTHGGIEVAIFDQNEDDAMKNKLLIRVERDIYNYVCALHTGSAVYDTYTNIKTAITKP